MADELEDLEAEIAELTRQLDESLAAEREQAIEAELQRLVELRNELLARRAHKPRKNGGR